MKKIGIVVAMDEEFEEVKRKMKDIKTKNIYNLEFVAGKIGKSECVLVKCGVGKVNAARTTQVMVDNFELKSIINVGSAGAINDKFEIGDVIIGKKVVQHDFDITAFNHNKGYITGVGDSVECDCDMINKLKEMLANEEERKYNVDFGIVATGDIFCTDPKMKNKIRTKFNADIVDMECSAIAQVAYLDEIPFLVIRSISDSPNGKNASTFDENLILASKRSANILEKLLQI